MNDPKQIAEAADAVNGLVEDVEDRFSDLCLAFDTLASVLSTQAVTAGIPSLAADGKRIVAEARLEYLRSADDFERTLKVWRARLAAFDRLIWE